MHAINDDAAGQDAEAVAEGVAPSARPRVRDRIFETACELFYRHGVREVCVDAIAAEAGTNKMSFYRSFASKEDLVAEYLREQERQLWARWDATIAPHRGDLRLQIEALFEAHVAAVQDKSCRGCALGNVAVEMTEDDDRLNALIRAYKKEVRKRLRRMAHDLGARHADALGDALMLLMDGAYSTRRVFPGHNGPVAALLPAVRALLDAHLQPA